MGGGPSSSR
jgi:hypothetical protein